MCTPVDTLTSQFQAMTTGSWVDQLGAHKHDENKLAFLISQWRKSESPTVNEILITLQQQVPGCNVYDVIDFLWQKEKANPFHINLLLAYEKVEDIAKLSADAQPILIDILNNHFFPEDVREVHFTHLLSHKITLAVELTPVVTAVQLARLFSALEKLAPENEEFTLLKRTLELLPTANKREAVTYFCKRSRLLATFECDVRNNRDYPGRDILFEALHDPRFPPETLTFLKSQYLGNDIPVHSILLFFGIFTDLHLTKASPIFELIEKHHELRPVALPLLLKLCWFNDLYLCTDPQAKERYMQKLQAKFESIATGILENPTQCWKEKIEVSTILNRKQKTRNPLLKIALLRSRNPGPSKPSSKN